MKMKLLQTYTVWETKWTQKKEVSTLEVMS